MLKWIDGSKPGKATKRKSDPSEVVARKKNYEDNRRTRKFIPQWKKDRPWLTFCEETNLMFCTYCKDNGKENIFVKGCNNFRLDSLNAHELSEPHKSAKSIAERPVVLECEAAKAVVQLKSHDNTRMNILCYDD